MPSVSKDSTTQGGDYGRVLDRSDELDADELTISAFDSSRSPAGRAR